MGSQDKLVLSLSKLRSTVWINQYFDLLQKLLSELNLDDSDPRLALSIPKNGLLPVNLGQRYVLLPKPDQFVRVITPLGFDEATVGGELIGYFYTRKQPDMKWIQVHFPVGAQFPPSLYRACVDACLEILLKSKRSGFRKHHVSLLYDLVMDVTERSNALTSLKLVS
jgi:hypothetical protein